MLTEREIEALINEYFNDIDIDECILRAFIHIDVSLRLWRITEKIGIVLSPKDFFDNEISSKRDIMHMICNKYKRGLKNGSQKL